MKSKKRKSKIFKEQMQKHANDKEYILNHFNYDISTLKLISKELLKDRDFVLQMVGINGLSLKYVSEKLRNDKEVVIKALQNSSGFALKYASEPLRADREVVNEAIKKWKAPLQYASPELREEANNRIRDYYKKHKI